MTAPAWTDPAADPIRDLREAGYEFLRTFGLRPRLAFQAGALAALLASPAVTRDVTVNLFWQIPKIVRPRQEEVLGTVAAMCRVERVTVLHSDAVRPTGVDPCLTLDTGAGLVWVLPDRCDCGGGPGPIQVTITPLPPEN